MACNTAINLLQKKSNLQVWHIPDWITDYNEQSEEPDDYVQDSNFTEQLATLKEMLETPKSFKEKPYTKDKVLEPFKTVGKEQLYDPDEYNAEKYPWYKTDDPNVI